MNIQMTPLEIIGLKNDLDTTVRCLRGLECVQIDNLSDSHDVSARPLTISHKMLVYQEETSYLLAQIESLLAALGGKNKSGDGSQAKYAHEEASNTVKSLLPIVKSLTSGLESLEAELASLPRYESTLRKLLPIVPDSARDRGNASVGVLVSRAHIAVLDSVAKRIIELTEGKADIVASDVDSSLRAMLVVFPQRFTNDIEALLGHEDVSRLRLPAELGDGTPDMVLASLYRRMASIPEDIRELQARLVELGSKWCVVLANLRAALREEVEINSVFSKFGETDNTFVLVGWVPTTKIAEVKSALAKDIGENILIHPLEMTEELKKHAPVALKNPLPARPFESLIQLLALPRYGHIDPTRLMALFLPIFFGMILGDIGYGVLLLSICLILLFKIRKGMMRDLLVIMAISSTWSIVFGFLYGEFFGTLGEHLGLHALWLDRASSENVSTLLLGTLVVGSVHITLGLILGVLEAFRDRDRNELYERSGMLLGLVCLFLLVGSGLRILPKEIVTPASTGMVIGILLLGLPLGRIGPFIGVIEFICLVGNILSYLRIAAIGLASVYLAKVANDVAGMTSNILVSITVMVLGHGLNLVMGAFSPTIHSLRLHYVEFFRKFYTGGGRPYQPFRKVYITEKH